MNERANEQKVDDENLSLRGHRNGSKDHTDLHKDAHYIR